MTPAGDNSLEGKHMVHPFNIEGYAAHIEILG